MPARKQLPNRKLQSNRPDQCWCLALTWTRGGPQTSSPPKASSTWPASLFARCAAMNTADPRRYCRTPAASMPPRRSTGARRVPPSPRAASDHVRPDRSKVPAVPGNPLDSARFWARAWCWAPQRQRLAARVGQSSLQFNRGSTRVAPIHLRQPPDDLYPLNDHTARRLLAGALQHLQFSAKAKGQIAIIELGIGSQGDVKHRTGGMRAQRNEP